MFDTEILVGSVFLVQLISKSSCSTYNFQVIDETCMHKFVSLETKMVIMVIE